MGIYTKVNLRMGTGKEKGLTLGQTRATTRASGLLTK